MNNSQEKVPVENLELEVCSLCGPLLSSFCLSPDVDSVTFVRSTSAVQINHVSSYDGAIPAWFLFSFRKYRSGMRSKSSWLTVGIEQTPTGISVRRFEIGPAVPSGRKGIRLSRSIRIFNKGRVSWCYSRFSGRVRGESLPFTPAIAVPVAELCTSSGSSTSAVGPRQQHLRGCHATLSNSGSSAAASSRIIWCGLRQWVSGSGLTKQQLLCARETAPPAFRWQTP
jgi:hypothetical protein